MKIIKTNYDFQNGRQSTSTGYVVPCNSFIRIQVHNKLQGLVGSGWTGVHIFDDAF